MSKTGLTQKTWRTDQADQDGASKETGAAASNVRLWWLCLNRERRKKHVISSAASTGIQLARPRCVAPGDNQAHVRETVAKHPPVFSALHLIGGVEHEGARRRRRQIEQRWT